MNENKIDTIYKAHVNDLFSYALSLGFDRETAMDAIHDVFCKICADKIGLATIINMRFYLLRLLKNRLLDIYKLKKEISGLPLEATADNMPFIVRVTVEDEFIENEELEITRRKIENMLTILTDRQREIIYLRFSQNCNYEEIAQIMHITPPACRKLLHKAISKLREASGESTNKNE
jgi:RNA polymerase sigma factor (sigma-70 family)